MTPESLSAAPQPPPPPPPPSTEDLSAPLVPSTAPAPGEMVRAHRRAAGSALPGLALLWLVALVSPLLSYRSDLRNAEEELVGHLSDRAALQAQALAAHLELLRAELQRLADHRGLQPEDGLSPAEHALLDGAFGHTPLFSGGVALLSTRGERLWSEPVDMNLGRTPVLARRWFRSAAEGSATVDLLEGDGDGLIVVVVPVLRPDGVQGVLVGELSTMTQVLPGARAGDDALLLLIDEQGRVLRPARAPREAVTPEVAARLRSLVENPGPLSLGETRLLGAAAPVAGSGLLLAILEDESHDRARLTRRYLGQMTFHVALLGGVMLVVTLLIRHSYRSLLAAEERLRRQETMAALGTASSLIAHEVKNALNGMQAALSMLRPQSGVGHELPVGALRSQVARLGHLARSLLSFASPRAASYRSCELRLLVEEAVQAVRMIPEAADVDVQTELQPDLFVLGDPALLVSAIDNIIRNAVEAGAVARDTGQQAAPRVEVRLTRQDGEAVVTIRDNAGGVPAEFEPRLWEPFAVGRAKGIGLGLPMVQTAVKAHHGQVTYTRIPGGSLFTLRLPLERKA